MEQYTEGYVASLVEAIEGLQDEVTRLRNLNRIQRVINSNLREQIKRANQNDENFKSFCTEDITDVDDEGGLPSEGLAD